MPIDVRRVCDVTARRHYGVSGTAPLADIDRQRLKGVYGGGERQ